MSEEAHSLENLTWKTSLWHTSSPPSFFFISYSWGFFLLYERVKKVKASAEFILWHISVRRTKHHKGEQLLSALRREDRDVKTSDVLRHSSGSFRRDPEGSRPGEREREREKKRKAR